MALLSDYASMGMSMICIHEFKGVSLICDVLSRIAVFCVTCPDADGVMKHRQFHKFFLIYVSYDGILFNICSLLLWLDHDYYHIHCIHCNLSLTVYLNKISPWEMTGHQDTVKPCCYGPNNTKNITFKGQFTFSLFCTINCTSCIDQLALLISFPSESRRLIYIS